MLGEPDWNDSDISRSDNDNKYFQLGLPPLDPLQEAQSSVKSDEDPEDAQQTSIVSSNQDDPITSPSNQIDPTQPTITVA